MNERKFLIRNVKKARDLINGKLIIKPKDKSGDLVTNFDEKLENFFIKKIKKAYPDFDIVSEETNSKKRLTKNCFVIDPIDGTNNFARKIPIWGIQVACIKNNETIASVIYLPVYDELYSADKTGAYLNDEKIHVNRQNEKIGVYTTGNQIPQEYEMQTKNPNHRHFGSAAFSLAMVACGKMSACFFREKVNPWDFIPGEYLVKMAGGYSFMKDHVRICANMQSWSNLLQRTEPLSIQHPSIIEKTETNIKKQTKVIEKQPIIQEKETTESQKSITLGKKAISKPIQKDISKSINIKTKEIIPEFQIEESEAIIETFRVEIPEQVQPKPLTVDEILVDKKEEPEKDKVIIKNNFKVVKKPTTLKPSTTRINLSEARKRKIIM